MESFGVGRDLGVCRGGFGVGFVVQDSNYGFSVVALVRVLNQGCCRRDWYLAGWQAMVADRLRMPVLAALGRSEEPLTAGAEEPIDCWLV